MDASFDRLLDVQKVGVQHTDKEIEQLEAFKSDYGAVIGKIQDLEKCLSKPAFLPFSSKALVPGKLIHTNEILIHLGGSDNYFAEVSTHEAVEMIRTRMDRLDATIEKLKKQRELITDRVKYTSEFARQAPHILSNPPDSSASPPSIKEDEEVEIRETYDSDTELKWTEKHKANRRKELAELRNLPSPTLKPPRVSFDLSNVESSNEIDHSATDSQSSDTSDSSPIRAVIYFKHSDLPSPFPRVEVPDLSSLSISEAVDMVVRHGKISPTESINKPFGEITEREPDNVDSPVLPPQPPARISRFRSERAHQKSS
ncbi:unnamed protein product [Calicophoron daubneyi]|uniref:Unconventional prefoldin RPB5 interactor n=1 Tax=Calicophoron daubneyi TaxID=300641 RepID=A0AAV2TJU8_CALDB